MQQHFSAGQVNEVNPLANDQNIMDTLFFSNLVYLALDMIDRAEIDRHIDAQNFQMRALRNWFGLHISEGMFVIALVNIRGEGDDFRV